MRFHAPRYNWQAYCYGSISLCMIMRDNAKTLPRCLSSVKGLIDETIIVDTGSVDDSVQLAKDAGCVVLHDAWQDDFSRPRNISIDHATKQWILIMDPDEVILRKDHEAVRLLTRSNKILAWRLTTRNYSKSNSEVGFRTLIGDIDPGSGCPGFVPSTKTRLFKRGHHLRFKGCWHELLDWKIIRDNVPVATCPIPVHHWGHEISQGSIKEKTLFYLRMGEKKVKEWPSNGQAWWELAVAQAIVAQRGAAARSVAQAFRLGFGAQSQYFLLSRLLRLLDRKVESDLAFQKGVCKLYPNLTHIDPLQKPAAALLDLV